MRRFFIGLMVVIGVIAAICAVPIPNVEPNTVSREMITNVSLSADGTRLRFVAGPFGYDMSMGAGNRALAEWPKVWRLQMDADGITIGTDGVVSANVSLGFQPYSELDTTADTTFLIENGFVGEGYLTKRFVATGGRVSTVAAVAADPVVPTTLRSPLSSTIEIVELDTPAQTFWKSLAWPVVKPLAALQWQTRQTLGSALLIVIVMFGGPIGMPGG